METLLTQALGRGAPWRAVSVDFKPGEGPIAFEIESTAKRATCPACGAVE
jgi:transposase